MWRRPQTTNALERIWFFCDGSMLGSGVIPAASGPTAGGSADLPNRLRGTAQCAAAAVARRPDGSIVDCVWQTIRVRTNNEAEYAGLMLALELAKRLRVREAICVLDSAVVVGQMQGRCGVHSRLLQKWHWHACAAARAIPTVRYCLVPREWNLLADGLARQATLPWTALVAKMEEQLPGSQADNTHE